VSGAHKTSAFRAFIVRVAQGASKMLYADFTGRYNESHAQREYFQHYGFASCPLPGSEGVPVMLGGDVNNIIMVATEDRRYKLVVKPGEVGLYTDEGDYVLLGRGNVIHAYSKNEIIAEAPTVQVKGNLLVDGNITATGDITDKTRSMDADRKQYFNPHRHNDSAPPTPQE